jgi:hypothetical protein
MMTPEQFIYWLAGYFTGGRDNDDAAAVVEDISKAEPMPFPDCNQLMWLSEKKLAAINFFKTIGTEILFCCSHCLPEKLKQNFELLNDVKQIARIQL